MVPKNDTELVRKWYENGMELVQEWNEIAHAHSDSFRRRRDKTGSQEGQSAPFAKLS